MTLAGACTLGDGDENGPSPYDDASLTVASANGVADGHTAVDVTVTGAIGSRLTLVITGNAAFVVPDQGTTVEKTVFLTDVEGAGQATARVRSGAAGTVSVSFKPDPLRTPRSIEFHEVMLAAGAGTPVDLSAGVVEHHVCIASSSPVGRVRTSSYQGTGGIEPRDTITATMPAGLDCPSSGAEPLGWNGYAVLSWTTRDDSAEVDLAYVTDDDATLASVESVALEGEAFPGYEVVTGSPQFSDFASVTLTVTYPALGSLAAGPAAGVAVDQRFIPAPGPTFLGSSSGDESSTPVTGDDGSVTLFFDTSVPGTFAWFATLTGGENVQLSDLVIP